MSVQETADFIAGVVLIHQFKRGGQPCPQIDWVVAQEGREDTDQVRLEYVEHPTFQASRPFHTMNGLRVALTKTTPDRDAVLLFWAEQVALQPHAMIWGHMERLILGEKDAAGEWRLLPYGQLLTAEAWAPIISWHAINGKNPKAFFARADVLAMIPASIDLTNLPHGSRQELAGVELHGLREV